MNKRNWTLILGVLALLMMVSGCKKKPPPTPPAPPPKPVTATLSANPTSIQRGQSSTLTWSTDGADDVTLEGQKVNTSGSQSVTPTDTTTYHLVAKGTGGTQEATAQVTVSAPPPPPTPTPTPAPQVTDEQLFAQAAQDIYFDFDKADLRPQSQQILAHLAEVVKAHPNWKVQIEGNCDERGSEQYNLALGQRRADSAKKYLAGLGVKGPQITAISFGAEKPKAQGHDEEAWRQNRRDDLNAQK